MFCASTIQVLLWVQLAIACEPGWKFFWNNCYKEFSTTNITNLNTEAFCVKEGGHLTSITSSEEREFVTNLAHKGYAKTVGFQTGVGLWRDSVTQPWRWLDGSYYSGSWWHKREPDNQSGNERCVMLTSDVMIGNSNEKIFSGEYGYFLDVACYFPARSFVCKKRDCPSPHATAQNGECVCKDGYVDIVDTPDAGNYKRGDKCVESICKQLKGATTVLFLIDSSESITLEHWPSLVQFVKNGSSKLPNSFRIGFVKFSDNVSAKKWIKPGWTVDQFQNAVPNKFDSGQTNTPAALREARKMLKKDRSDNKIIVLITDGLPMATEYETQEEAINATREVATSLSKENIKLTIMGMGPKLYEGIPHVKDWLKDQKNDYFSFTNTADCLKRTDMDKLLMIVCRNRRQ